MQCPQHPDRPATLACTRCGALQCEQCARPVGSLSGSEQHRKIRSCVRCAGLVHERSLEAQPDTLRQLLLRPLGLDGLASLIALAVPGWASALPGLLGLAFSLLYLGILAGYFFRTVEHVGQGKAGLPFSAEAAGCGAVLGQLAKGILCMVLASLPALLWVWLGGAAAGSWTTLLWLALGFACAPAFILGMVITDSVLGGLWPGAWVQVITRAPRSYGRLMAVFVPSVLVWGVGMLIVQLTVGRLPIFGTLLAAAANNLLILEQAVLLGGFLQREADTFGLAYQPSPPPRF